MGDRASIEVVQVNATPAAGQPERCFSMYSHWGGYKYAHDLAKALEKARPRWTDFIYCGRIISDQFLKDLRDEETGGGLYGGRCCTETEHPLLTVNIPDKTVTIGASDSRSSHPLMGQVYSFDAFIANKNGILDALCR